MLAGFVRDLGSIPSIVVSICFGLITSYPIKKLLTASAEPRAEMGISPAAQHYIILGVCCNGSMRELDSRGEVRILHFQLAEE